MKAKRVAAASIVLLLLFSSGCDSGRLTQFSNFAAAGSLYVQNLHKVIAQAGSAMIASDSAVLATAGKLAGKDVVSSHKDQYAKDIQTNDAELQQYLSTLQIVDGHATLLGAYFDAMAKLANSKGEKTGTQVSDLLDSIQTLNPKLETATLKAAGSSKEVKDFEQSLPPLVVAHFEVRALDAQLKKDAPTVDQALALQEAAIAAIGSQMKDSLASFLQVRESSEVIDPFLKNAESLPADWNSNREAFLRAKVTISSVDNAKAAITQLRKDFRKLAEDKDATVDFAALLDELNKMSGYGNALQSTAKTK